MQSCANNILKGLGSIRPIFGHTISENIKVCIIFEFLLKLYRQNIVQKTCLKFLSYIHCCHGNPHK